MRAATTGALHGSRMASALSRRRTTTSPLSCGTPGAAGIAPGLDLGRACPCGLSSRQLHRNFLLMAAAFATNHATVTALIGLATTNLDPEIGNLQTALLYACYTLTALVAARPILHVLGSKKALLSGLAMYVLYDASFILADRVPHLAKPAACVGGCLGGLAAGFLWTAQFDYFGKNVALIALTAGPLSEDAEQQAASAGARLAGWFAGLYLGLELLFKLLQSYIGQDSGPGSAGWAGGKDAIFVINTAVAAAATLACCFILDIDKLWLESESDQKPPEESGFEQVMAAGLLFVRDPKMSAMASMNFVFGFSVSYMNGYICGVVSPYYIKDGASYNGYLLAVSALAAAFVSLPNSLGLLSGMRWKKYMMVCGPICFGLVAALPLGLGFSKIAGSTGWGLVLLFVLQGLGRGVWESTNKTIFLEYFDDTVLAGSNLVLQNGGATAAAFFINAYSPAMPTVKDCEQNGKCPVYATEAWILLVFSILAVVGFAVASRLHVQGIASWGALCDARKDLDDQLGKATKLVDESDELDYTGRHSDVR